MAQALGIDVTLEPGTVSEEVMVRASDVPNVDLETSQVSNIVDSKRILESAAAYARSLRVDSAVAGNHSVQQPARADFR